MGPPASLLVPSENPWGGGVHICHFVIYGPMEQKLLYFKWLSYLEINYIFLLYRLVWILAKLPSICTCNFALVCLEKCWAQLSLLSPGFLLSAWKIPQVQQTVLHRKRACELALCTLLHWFKLSEPFAHKPWNISVNDRVVRTLVTSRVA
jgi:hypothetical protein